VLVRDHWLQPKHTGDGQADEDTGSATVIGYDADSQDALILGCYHVIEQPGHYSVVFGHGSGPEISATVLAAAPGDDLSLLVVHVGAKVPFTKIADAAPPAGAPIYKAGFPSGQFNCRTGQVIDGNGFTAALIVRPGDSGCGVFDGKGYLVAVATSYQTNHPNVARGMPVGPIQRLVQSTCWPRRCPPKQPPSQPPAVPPIVIPPAPPAVDLSKIESALGKLTDQFSKLEQSVTDLQKRPPPRDGKDGQDGKAGANADLGPILDRLSKIEQQLQQKPAPPVTPPAPPLYRMRPVPGPTGP